MPKFSDFCLILCLSFCQVEFENFGLTFQEVDARVQTLDMVKADKETIQIEIDLVRISIFLFSSSLKLNQIIAPES